jgi:hypothetical protein
MPSMALISDVLQPDQWTDAEKWVIRWQYRLLGDFQAALAEAITRADDSNLERLALGFSDQVAGFIDWSRGNLSTRLREAGLDI